MMYTRPNADLCPPHIKGAIDRYFENRIPPGDFTRAVLENDLAEAIGRADPVSLAALHHIVCYLYNHCPGRSSGAWGSREIVDDWLAFDE